MKKIHLAQFSSDELRSLQELIKTELIKRHGTHQKKCSKSIMRRILIIHGLRPEDYTNEERAITEIRLYNSRFLLALPRIKKPPFMRKHYLSSLIAQNWKELYPRETDIGEYYVYAHVDPRLSTFVTTEDAGGNYGGQPFYIGKGIGNRAHDLKRNEGHGKTIKEILDATWPPTSIVNILFTGLSELKALEIESKLIYFFGIQYSIERKGWLVNLTQPPVPKFEGTMTFFPNEAWIDE